MKTYPFIEDSGHGWLAVPETEVRQSGADISPYSYHDRRKGIVYLEEDCDCLAFLKAANLIEITHDDNGKRQVTRRFREDHQYHDGSCFVRNLPSWQGKAA